MSHTPGFELAYGSVACIAHKGGTGKTTTATLLAASTAAAGGRVLLVDLCGQANASLVMSIPEDATPNVGGIFVAAENGDPALVEKTRAAARNAIVRSPWSDEPEIAAAGGTIDVIPGDINIDSVVTMTNAYLLRVALGGPISESYHLIVFDLPPSLGPVTQAALIAAHGALVVLEPEYFATRGLTKTVDVIVGLQQQYQEAGEDTAGLLGVLVCQFDARLKEHHANTEAIRSWTKANGVEFFGPPIPRRSSILKVQSRHLTLFGARSEGAAITRLHSSLASRILRKIGDTSTLVLVNALSAKIPKTEDYDTVTEELTDIEVADLAAPVAIEAPVREVAS